MHLQQLLGLCRKALLKRINFCSMCPAYLSLRSSSSSIGGILGTIHMGQAARSKEHAH
jgi:hypothetical protein